MLAFLFLPHHLPSHVLQPRPRRSSSLFHHPLRCPSFNPASGRPHVCPEKQEEPNFKGNHIPENNEEGAGSRLLFGPSLEDDIQHRFSTFLT